MSPSEKAMYEKNASAGKLDPKVLEFKEEGNEDPGALKADLDAREAEKKA